MPRKPDILLLTDGGNIGADLDILYPGRVKRLNFAAEKHGISVLREFSHVVTVVQDGSNLRRLNYDAVETFAERGGKVVSCLYEYAMHRGLHFSKTHVGDTAKPALRIEVECDTTKGFAKGDTIPWYGTVSSAPDPLYDNQRLQRQVMGVRESGQVRILATSTVNGGAVMIEEQVGEGAILALDLLSPLRPFFNSHGSTNKYLFAGNFLGGAVRHGRHYPERLCYDEFVEEMYALSRSCPHLQMMAEGPCSDGREMWTLRLGDPANPTMYFGGAVHGWEWENAFGLLRLAELVAEDPRIEGLRADSLHFVIMPIQNPYGYDHFLRQNARGVDLNRNFDCGWEAMPVPQDVVVPWDYNYKGACAASESETQAIQGLLDHFRPRCVVDFHTADYVLILPHEGDDKLMDAIQNDIKRRLKDRYLVQQPYNGKYQQVNMNNRMERSAPLPYLISYAADLGCPAAFLIEMSGNRDDVHALVMNTDTVVEICLAAVKECLKWKG